MMIVINLVLSYSLICKTLSNRKSAIVGLFRFRYQIRNKHQ